MKEDTFILFVTVVIVPVKTGRNIPRGKGQGPHGNGIAHIRFAGAGNTDMVKEAHDHAYGYTQNLGELVPAAERQGVQAEFFANILNGKAGFCD
jgi:hypothetical protein